MRNPAHCIGRKPAALRSVNAATVALGRDLAKPRPVARRVNLSIGAAILASLVILSACVAVFAARPPVWDLVATTATGDAYVIGSGDDCRAAWRNVRIPADWTSVRCEPSSR